MSRLTPQEGIWAFAALPVWPHGLLEHLEVSQPQGEL